jgi:hypothetical protein
MFKFCAGFSSGTEEGGISFSCGSLYYDEQDKTYLKVKK